MIVQGHVIELNSLNTSVNQNIVIGRHSIYSSKLLVNSNESLFSPLFSTIQNYSRRRSLTQDPASLSTTTQKCCGNSDWKACRPGTNATTYWLMTAYNVTNAGIYEQAKKIYTVVMYQAECWEEPAFVHTYIFYFFSRHTISRAFWTNACFGPLSYAYQPSR